jgi:hypothetical protein
VHGNHKEEVERESKSSFVVGTLRFLYLKSGSVGKISNYWNRAFQTSAAPFGEARHPYLRSVGE